MNELGLSVVLIRQIARGVGAFGGDASGFLQRAGVDATSQGYVPEGVVLPLIEAASHDVVQPNLGLAVARALQFGQLGFIEYCVATSPDLREGLKRTCRFFALLSTRAELTFEEGDGTARVTQRMHRGAPHVRHLTDLLFARLALSMKTLVAGGVEIHAMRFAYPARDAREHVDIFGPRVSFDAALDELEIDAAALARPLLTSDPAVAAMLEQHAVKLHGELAPSDPLMGEVRASIAKRLVTGSHALEVTAADLGVPRRTLQRRLTERKTSYRDVVDQVRRELATDWVKRRETSYTEIAYALGFADPTAFYRAFRRWTGGTPEAFSRASDVGGG